MARSSPQPVRADRSGAHPVVWTGLVLVILQVLARGVALSHGWFYGDDYALLTQAHDRPLSLSYLITPHDSQLMPGGLLGVWLVSRAGAFPWGAVMAEVLTLQLLASLACLLMLVRVLGVRWWCLAPLAFYLFSPMTLSGFMWWAAALNQLPAQLAFFLLITCHVQHLRTGRAAWAVLAALSLVLGLLFYVKAALFVLPVLVLSVLYLAPAGATWAARVRLLLQHRWSLWGAYGAVTLGYLAFYVTHVPDPTKTPGTAPYAALMRTMLGVSLPTMALGGPWRWSPLNAPLGLVATPGWAVGVCWAVLVVAVVVVVRRRGPDLRPLLVVAPYVLASVVLVARARASVFGDVVGLEPRYLADSAPLLTLGLALVVAGPPGVRRTFSPRHRSADPGARLLAPAAVVIALGVGAAVSTVGYARMWADDWSAKHFTRAVIAQTEGGPLVLADAPVPAGVVGGWASASNLPSRVLAPLGDRVRVTTRGTDLQVLDDGGQARDADVTPDLVTAPGPREGCGYLLDRSATDLPLTGPGVGPDWWAQVSYLSATRGTAVLEAGRLRDRLEVRPGLHSYLVHGRGPITSIAMSAASPDVRVCLDHVHVGKIEARTGAGP